MSSTNGPAGIGIEVKITDRCNQQCFHCANNDGGSGETDIDHLLFIDRLKDYAGTNLEVSRQVKEVRITGGEPLLNMAGLVAIADCCNDLDIKCGINTNGVLLADGELVGKLKDSGIGIIKVSLDSLDRGILRRMRGGKAHLDDALSGISMGVESGFEVIIRFTITALNRDELLPCFRYAREVGATRFQVKPLIESGRGSLCGAGLTPGELSLALEELSKARDQDSCIPEVLCTPLEESFGMAGKYCGSVNKIYIYTNGDVCSCNFIPFRSLGSINTMSLAEIIETRSEREIFTRVKGVPVLAGCSRYSIDELRIAIDD